MSTYEQGSWNDNKRMQANMLCAPGPKYQVIGPRLGQESYNKHPGMDSGPELPLLWF